MTSLVLILLSSPNFLDFQDVVQAICGKLSRRHPHVFQAEQFSQLSADDVAVLWQDIKRKEKRVKLSTVVPCKESIVAPRKCRCRDCTRGKVDSAWPWKLGQSEALSRLYSKKGPDSKGEWSRGEYDIRFAQPDLVRSGGSRTGVRATLTA